MSRLIVATDGSCLVNPGGPGGWAWITEDQDFDHGHHPNTTNNIMELTAIHEAILAHPDRALLIQSDSSYSINCVTKWGPNWRKRGWKKAGGEPVKNADLIDAIMFQLDSGDVVFEWVKGHNGHLLNEAADSLASIAANKSRKFT